MTAEEESQKIYGLFGREEISSEQAGEQVKLRG